MWFARFQILDQIISKLCMYVFLGQRELTPKEKEKARQKLHKNWDDYAEGQKWEPEMCSSRYFRFRFSPRCRPSICVIFDRIFFVLPV